MCGIVCCVWEGGRFGCAPACRGRMCRARCRWAGAIAVDRRYSDQGMRCAIGAIKMQRKGRWQMTVSKKPSPCLFCKLVADPRACEDKSCKLWQEWFLQRWEMIHAYPRKHMEQAELKPVGVNIGGTYYAAPHQVRRYRDTDPCESCVCPKELCSMPCPLKRAWEEACKEVFL